MTSPIVERTHLDASPEENIQLKWIGALLMLLAVCLVVNDLTLSHPPLAVLLNDLLVGFALFACGMAQWFGVYQAWFPWLIFALGAYLQVAPLFVWAPQPSQYLNQTLIGIVAASVGALIPFMQEDAVRQAPITPSGWSYNPSSWSQRLPVFILCLICWFIARYMAAYQLGYISTMWDPFFGDNGTLQVITSPLSKSFPVSDAGLGAALYAIEALCVWKGGSARWYTSPAFVLFFGILVIPGGCVSILLIMSQPLIVGHWCFWCLLTAVCMLGMIALAADEVAAALQFLKNTYQTDPSHFWSTFWHGGKGKEDYLSNSALQQPPLESKGWAKGISFPISLILSALVGGWLMLSPSLHGREDILAHVEDAIGPLAITVSIIAMAEVMRPIRYANLFFGLTLCLMLVFTEASERMVLAEALLAGLLLIFLSFPKGKIHERYGDLKPSS